MGRDDAGMSRHTTVIWRHGYSIAIRDVTMADIVTTTSQDIMSRTEEKAAMAVTASASPSPFTVTTTTPRHKQHESPRTRPRLRSVPSPNNMANGYTLRRCITTALLRPPPPSQTAFVIGSPRHRLPLTASTHGSSLTTAVRATIASNTIPPVPRTTTNGVTGCRHPPRRYRSPPPPARHHGSVIARHHSPVVTTMPGGSAHLVTTNIFRLLFSQVNTNTTSSLSRLHFIRSLLNVVAYHDATAVNVIAPYHHHTCRHTVTLSWANIVNTIPACLSDVHVILTANITTITTGLHGYCCHQYATVWSTGGTFVA